jgi:hypothetical protein
VLRAVIGCRTRQVLAAGHAKVVGKNRTNALIVGHSSEVYPDQSRLAPNDLGVAASTGTGLGGRFHDLLQFSLLRSDVASGRELG